MVFDVLGVCAVDYRRSLVHHGHVQRSSDLAHFDQERFIQFLEPVTRVGDPYLARVLTGVGEFGALH